MLIASSTNRRVDSFALLPAGIFYCLPLRKIITPQSLLCLWSKIIRKFSLAHHKSLFFSWKVDLLSFKKHGGRIGRKQTQKNCEVETTFEFFICLSFICFAISSNFNFAVNLVTPFSRQKTLKSKNKKHRIFLNTKPFYHPAKFELKRIKNAN